tara:strand:- start:252 stop:620 length:369 start_codon:yes stop_codon:yes gene_type:complete
MVECYPDKCPGDEESTTPPALDDNESMPSLDMCWENQPKDLRDAREEMLAARRRGNVQRRLEEDVNVRLAIAASLGKATTPTPPALDIIWSWLPDYLQSKIAELAIEGDRLRRMSWETCRKI